jgi:hypothetical protein
MTQSDFNHLLSSNGEFLLVALLLEYRPSPETGELKPWFNRVRRNDDT